MRVRFGRCTVDTESRELLRGERPVHLTRKAFDLLEYLLDQRPSAVTKAQLHDRLWPGVAVTDASLANLVSELRRAIGDRSEQPEFLRTVHGFGYAFCGEVSECAVEPRARAEASSFSLVLLGREFPLREGENVLGRGLGVVASINDASVSRQHALIRIGPEGADLEDLNSKNGTRLNGARIGERVALNDLDEIQLGDVPLTFRHLSTEISTRTGMGQERSRRAARAGKP